MFSREELLMLEEELIKASDRIKFGKRTSKKTDLSNAEIHTMLSRLVKDPNISSAARDKLKEMHGSFAQLAEQDAKKEAMRRAGPKLEVGAKAAQQKVAEDTHQATVDKWLETNNPKREKGLGHAKQYQKDVESPQMRSKSAGKMTGPVKERLATGEGIAIRDKNYGAALDAQAKVKASEAKIRASKGPSEVIHVPAHENDEVVRNLRKLKSVSPEHHHPKIDEEITKRITTLKGSA